MSFTDLFARYREMGAMGPQPFDDPALLFNDAGNTWTHFINGDSKVRSSCDEEFEELFSSSHRLGLNLGLLKNNNVCKDYCRLTSNVLRSLIMGIKEIATEKITPAWHVGFPCASPKKSFSSLIVKEDAIYPKLTIIQSSGEIGTSTLSSFSHPVKLPMREVVNIANLRRCLWSQIGLPVSYLASTWPVNENYSAEAVIEQPRSLDSQKQAISEAQLVDGEDQSREIPCKDLEEVTSCIANNRLLEEDNTVVSPNTSEMTDTKANDEITIHGNSARTPPGSTAEDDEAPTKHSTDSESDHERLKRRPRPLNQTASGNKQFTSSVRSREDKENPKKYHDVQWTSVSPKNYSVPISSRPGEVERQVSSSRHRQTVVGSNNEASMLPRPKSWCLVGGYVKRFPTKHHLTSPKIQPPSKSQPQVPLAA